jgi:excisionase family DNA binding protein
MQETVSLEEAATLCKASKDTIGGFATRGELPGARIGKHWVFFKDDVLTFIRSHVVEQTLSRKEQLQHPKPVGRITRNGNRNSQ